MSDKSAAGGGPTDRFPCSSQVFGLAALAGLAVIIVFVVLDGASLGHWAVLVALVLFGLGVWLTMIRPAVHTHDDHVLVRNALTDTKVPWHLVESVEVRQVLVIRTEQRTVRGIAVGRSTRQLLRSRRSSDTGRGFRKASMLGGDSVARVDYADFVTERLSDLASANRRASTRLETLDKRWRLAEVIAVVGVMIAFGLLLALAISG